MKIKALFLILFLLALPVFVYAFDFEEEETLISSLKVPRNLMGSQPIRVLIDHETDFFIDVKPPIYVKDGSTGDLVFTFPERRLTFQKKKSGFLINGTLFRNPELRFVSDGPFFTFKEKNYAGDFLIQNREWSLFVVNEIELEVYLRGVLPSEIFPTWPEEAILAQAIASRTYALFSMIKNDDKGFHVVSTTASQVYGGAGRHHPVTDKAVLKTRGKILTYQGEIFPTFFHANSGGHTTPAHQVWDIDPHPCLTTTFSKHSWNSPHYFWDYTLTLKELESKLKEAGVIEGKLLAIQKKTSDGLGRISTFTLMTDRGMQSILANKLRLLMGPDELRSTFFHMIGDGEKYQLKGFGWGHGVGLDQWGAKGMAEAGFSHQQILSHYYPNSELSQVQNSL